MVTGPRHEATPGQVEQAGHASTSATSSPSVSWNCCRTRDTLPFPQTNSVVTAIDDRARSSRRKWIVVSR